MRRQASPAYRAGQAKLVKPLGIVVRNAPREDMPLPCIGRNFESLELPQYLQRGPFTLDLCSRSNVLPAEQPAHELRGRDGLNLFSQGRNGESMDSRQKPPLAPLSLVRRGRPRPRPLIGKLPAQDGSTRFQAQKRLFDFRERKPEHRSQLLRRDWPQMRYPAGNQCEHGVVARGNCALDFNNRSVESRTREEQGKNLGPFCCDPVLCTLVESVDCSAVFEQLPEIFLPAVIPNALNVAPAVFVRVDEGNLAITHGGALLRWTDESVRRYVDYGKRDQRVQDVMQFVCVAHVWPSFFANLRNRRGIKLSDFLEYRFRQDPPHLYGTSPPLFERGVVEIGIRIRIEDLMRELRRHRGVDGDASDAAVSHAAQQALKPVQIHRLGQHVFHHFVHQRMVRNLNVSRNIFLARGD